MKPPKVTAEQMRQVAAWSRQMNKSMARFGRAMLPAVKQLRIALEDLACVYASIAAEQAKSVNDMRRHARRKGRKK